MIKVYTCNNDGTPSKAITVNNREELIKMFARFIDRAGVDTDMRDFHCTVTGTDSIDQLLGDTPKCIEVKMRSDRRIRNDWHERRGYRSPNVIGRDCDCEYYERQFEH